MRVPQVVQPTARDSRSKTAGIDDRSSARQLTRERRAFKQMYKAPYQIWPTNSGYGPKQGKYEVAQPGGQPIFRGGTYYWPEEQATEIANQLNHQLAALPEDERDAQ